MKTYKLYFTGIIIVLLSSISFPQIALKQGVYSLSGGGDYSYTKNTMPEASTKIYSFTVAPTFSYFVIDYLLIGGKFSFNYNENQTDFSSRFNNISIKTIRRQFGIGPIIRYYFTGFNIIPFAEIGYSYSNEISSDQDGNTFLFSAGLNYFLSNSVALEPFLAYSIGSFNNPEQDINTFSIGIRINYFIVN